MQITQKFIQESQIKNEGTTSYIMEHKSGLVFKIYKSLFDYIFNNAEYALEEVEVRNRLNYIVSKRNDVKLTKLPQDTLCFNGKIVGVTIEYFESGITLFEFLKDNLDVDLFVLKERILKIVDELIENGIIPTDPHFENFVITMNEDGTYQLNLIDTDDIYISVYPNGHRDVWYDSQKNACYRVIELSFKEIIEMKNKKFVG